MSFYSSAVENCPVIDDHNVADVLGEIKVGDDLMGRGLILRDYSVDPINGFASAFPFPLIPRSEWKDRIEQREKDKATLRGKIERHLINVKNQQSTNYCWCNAVTFAIEVVRMLQGQQHVELSPASVAAKIRNFQNQGGWGTEALKYIAQYGSVPSAYWPDNAIDRKYDTPDVNAHRANFKFLEWYDLKPRNFDQKMTLLFMGFPIPCGYNWWSHEICAVDPIIDKNGRFGTMEANSWGSSWGDKGYCILMEAKSTPDDAVCPRVAIAA